VKEGPELLERADGVVLFLCEGAKWAQNDPKRSEALNRLAKRGGGVVGLHWALGTKEAANIEGFLNLLGGCHGGPDRNTAYSKPRRSRTASKRLPPVSRHSRCAMSFITPEVHQGG